MTRRQQEKPLTQFYDLNGVVKTVVFEKSFWTLELQVRMGRKCARKNYWCIMFGKSVWSICEISWDEIYTQSWFLYESVTIMVSFWCYFFSASFQVIKCSECCCIAIFESTNCKFTRIVESINHESQRHQNTCRHFTQCAHVLATTVRVHYSSSAGGDEANTEGAWHRGELYRRAGARVSPGGRGGWLASLGPLLLATTWFQCHMNNDMAS